MSCPGCWLTTWRWPPAGRSCQTGSPHPCNANMPARQSIGSRVVELILILQQPVCLPSADATGGQAIQPGEYM
jgi:hypothetical protein